LTGDDIIFWAVVIGVLIMGAYAIIGDGDGGNYPGSK
jgi:hypothetical protein